jgi:methylated-DNA-protein-cysteine methyltransferase-like protein
MSEDEFDRIPWHRVINSQGSISHRVPIECVDEQASLLREEGVVVNDKGEHRYTVPLDIYGWFE